MKQRLHYLDFLRCLAIVLVIILHAMTPSLTNAELYGTRTWLMCMLQNPFNRAGVPLFFMLSGYLMLRDPRTSDVGGFYKKHIPRVAVPLLIWNLLYLLPSALAGGSLPHPAEYVSTLLNNGSGYHFWFVYTLIGIYLVTPFLKRIVDGCTAGQLAVLLGIILFPGAIRPLLNLSLPVYIYLFGPLLEGYLGYFLLGYLLGSHSLGPRARLAVYAGGVCGYVLSVWGNLSASSAAQISLPFNSGYSLDHYLLAAALFVFFRALFARWDAADHPNKVLAGLSDTVFGVYWVHVLVLRGVAACLSPALSLAQALCVQVLLTTVLSFSLMAVIARVPVLRRCLM